MGEDKVTFSMCSACGSLTINVEGKMTLDAIKGGEQVDSSTLARFVETDPSCLGFFKQWNMSNLLKIREMIAAFMKTMFKAYEVEKIALTWQNGKDVLEVGR